MDQGTRQAAPLRADWPLGVVIAAFTVLAWTRRFIQDDAFISFRYAENLTRGLGLVWNQGERVEGYTNFLWTMLMAIPIALGHDPVAFSMALGLTLYPLTLFLAWQLATRLLGERRLAWAALILLGTNFTFASFATGGLETQLQVCLFTAALLVHSIGTEDGWSLGLLAGLSAVLGLALLNRLDSGLLVALILIPTGLAVWRSRSRTPWSVFASLLLPMILLVGPWLIWKVAYYGSLLPNTAQAKLFSDASPWQGFRYLAVFVYFYWLLPGAILGMLALPRLLRTEHRRLRLPAALVALWLFYLVMAGGDFMEFRFLVPILPVLFVLLVWAIAQQVRNTVLRVVVYGITLLGSLSHALRFHQMYGIESVSMLHRHVGDRDGGWALAGRVLGHSLGDGSGVTIATSAAGAIPYYSRLRTVDMLGLNDRWVARHGLSTDPRPGHQRVAPLSYLLDRGVHLVIGHPQVRRRDAVRFGSFTLDELEELLIVRPQLSELPEHARVLTVPLDRDRVLLAVYLTPSPVVDRAIERQGWRLYAIERGGKTPLR